MTTKKGRASRLWFVLKFAYGVPDEVLDLVNIEEHADPTLEFRENLKVLLKRYPVLAQYIDDIEFKLDKADLAWRKYLSELQWLLENTIEGDESSQQELESLGFDIRDEKTVREFIETLITEGLISKEDAEELLRRWEEFVGLEEKPPEKPTYIIDSWVVRYVPSDKVFQFSYTVNGLRGFPLYFDSLEEVNEFLEKGEGEVYIPQERETGIVEWKPARIPRLFKFKVGEVIDTPTATYTLEQPLVKSDNPDVWVWQVAVWDKVKHEDKREYLTEDEIEKLKATIEEKPKRTPTLEDILAELEPLGYKERWRVVESLKAKGFKDVGETIDKIIREGKLRKVGKYIEATREVWREHEKKVAEKTEKEKEEKRIEGEIRKWIDEVKHTKEELFKPIESKYHELEEVVDEVKEETEILRLQNEVNNLLKAIDQAKEKFEQLLSAWGELHEKAINVGLDELALDIRLTRQDLEARLKDLDFYKKGLEAFLGELNEKLREIREKKPPAEEKPKEEKLPSKPPAEPYDFILEKLKSTFLAELELAGLGKEEAERELEAIMFEIERLARDVVEGKLPQVEAVKEVIKKARTITRPTEVAPPEELKVVKEVEPSRVRRAEEIWEERRAEYAPPPETTEMAMRIKDVMESLGWKGVVELLKPHLPEIFAYGIEDFLKRHREWSLAVPPTKGNVEAIFRNLRRSIEQRALEKYNRGELSFREWLIGGAPDRIRLPLLAMLLYYGYTSNAFKKELRKVYETPEIRDALKKYGVTSFDEFYNAMVEFLRQYQL